MVKLNLPLFDFVYARNDRRIASILSHLFKKPFIEHCLEPLSALMPSAAYFLGCLGEKPP
jgi:hypothetical protein